MAPSPAFCKAPCIATKRPSNVVNVWTCAVSSPSSQIDESKSAPVVDAAFSDWAKENKIEMAPLALTSFERSSENRLGNRGMVAQVAMKKGDSLISVPKPPTLQVTSFDRKRTPFPSKISQGTWQALPWYARLALRLLDAKIDSSNSLQPWISRLPSSFETPFHWTDKELKELQSPRMTAAVLDQRKRYRKLYDQVNGSPDNGLARSIQYSEFVWAVECIRSRAFSGPLEVAPFKERLRLFLFISANTLVWPALHALPWENALNGGLTALFALTVYDFILPKILRIVQGVELKRYAMTPGIDFINHSSGVTGKAAVSYEYFSDKFAVLAGEDYGAGDQVFISYGAQSNDSLLQFYGFVEENNPTDTYAFASGVERLLGMQEGKLVAKADGFDDQTIRTVTRKLKGNKDSALAALRELCTAELGGFPTTYAEDVEMLGKGLCDNDARLMLAVQYRIAKKSVLRRGQQ